MKLAIALLSLSVTVVAAMIYMAVSQEYKLHELKIRIVASSAEVKRKEQTIIEMKAKDKAMKTELVSVNSKVEELRKRKEKSVKVVQDLTNTLRTCSTETENVQKKKAGTGEAIVKLKADHEVAKNTAEAEIQNLKKQILDRDKAICVFADTTKEEARKLCGIPEAPK
ncbi:myosin-2 heavy chain [Cebidichthys violaceus]|uniref:myosin-2 heavy chain n=1 Tax=Cebidichthys violaceus TaxID=271503 RepID=UPI0035C9903C